MSLFVEKLRVYQLAITMSTEVFALTKTFPRGYADLIDQWRRAASSVPANLAEGVGRRAAGDKQHFYVMARGSVSECLPHLMTFYSLRFIDEIAFKRCKSQLELLEKMISNLIKTTF